MDENLTKELIGAIKDLTAEVRGLGLNNAHTPMGAIELLALEIKKGFTSVCDAINSKMI